MKQQRITILDGPVGGRMIIRAIRMPFWAGLCFLNRFLSLTFFYALLALFVLMVFARDADAMRFVNALLAVVFLCAVKALIPTLWLLGGTEVIDFSGGQMTYRIGAFEYGWPRSFELRRIGAIRIEEYGLSGHWMFGKTGGEPYYPGIVRFEYGDSDFSVGVQPLPLEAAEHIAAEIRRHTEIARGDHGIEPDAA